MYEFIRNALFHLIFNHTPDADVFFTDLLPFQSLVLVLGVSICQDAKHESLLSPSGGLQLPQAGHDVLQKPLIAAGHVERNSAVHEETEVLSPHSIKRCKAHKRQHQVRLSKTPTSIFPFLLSSFKAPARSVLFSFVSFTPRELSSKRVSHASHPDVHWSRRSRSTHLMNIHLKSTAIGCFFLLQSWICKEIQRDCFLLAKSSV